tara:strand:+ start:79 stop:927 length:849 start_codon:yes stop_codon:yes gene_type:complete
MNILSNTTENYKRWKEKKLESFTKNLDDLTVQINSPNAISKHEKFRVINLLTNHNIVFFHIDKIVNTDKLSIKNFADQIGLGNYELDSQSDNDGLTEIKDTQDKDKLSEYVPYTNKELNWHTDGYYTDQNNSVLAWMLFCKVAAENGGTNKYLDHEIAYILFNDKSDKLKDLMQHDACCIPTNILTNRKEVYNPVFMFRDEKLQMKFTMREKNIIWNKKSVQAINILKSIIMESSDYHIIKKLEPGNGVVTNNVIHMRTAFTNSKNKNRLLYRLRSKKRVIR